MFCHRPSRYHSFGSMSLSPPVVRFDHHLIDTFVLSFRRCSSSQRSVDAVIFDGIHAIWNSVWETSLNFQQNRMKLNIEFGYAHWFSFLVAEQRTRNYPLDAQAFQKTMEPLH